MTAATVRLALTVEEGELLFDFVLDVLASATGDRWDRGRSLRDKVGNAVQRAKARERAEAGR